MMAMNAAIIEKNLIFWYKYTIYYFLKSKYSYFHILHIYRHMDNHIIFLYYISYAYMFIHTLVKVKNLLLFGEMF